MKKLKDSEKLKPRFTFRSTDAKYKEIIKAANKMECSYNEYLIECHNFYQEK